MEGGERKRKMKRDAERERHGIEEEDWDGALEKKEKGDGQKEAE